MAEEEFQEQSSVKTETEKEQSAVEKKKAKEQSATEKENVNVENVKGTMKLIHVSDIIQDVFDITGFADILSIE